MKESNIINEIIRPIIGSSFESEDFANDTAFIQNNDNNRIVLTQDTIIEHIHFLSNTDPKLIAQKLLKVNLSDIASSAAIPYSYSMSLTLNHSTNNLWLTNFFTEIKTINDQFNINLIGGDIVSYTGPIHLSVTMFAKTHNNIIIDRKKAKDGDLIYCSGSIGDAALGLILLQELNITEQINLTSSSFRNLSETQQYLIKRYHIPEVKLHISNNLRPYVSSMTDISDGLIKDLKNILTTSKVGALIYEEKIPKSYAYKQIIKKYPQLKYLHLYGGDDYELLFTIPKKYHQKIIELKEIHNLNIHNIGIITKDQLTKARLKIFDGNNQQITIDERLGYEHFSS